MLLGKALTDEESDALELTLPVIPFGVKLSDARGRHRWATGRATAQADLTFPADACSRHRASCWSRVTPSVAGSIFGALEYLTTFPYGCVEQTMSSFLPNVVVSQAVQRTRAQDQHRSGRRWSKKIRAGLDRLYDFQHEDGGWGWWKTDESIRS